MRVSRLLGGLVVASLSGCGGGSVSIMPEAPHGGSILALPGGNNVEVLREDAAAKEGDARLIVYCLDAEMKPLSPAPTSANFKPRGRGGRGKDRGGKPVELKTTSNPDPAKAGELASEPFQGPGEVSGELTLVIGGKPVSVEIGVH